MSKELLKTAGDFLQELEDATLENITGAASVEARGISQDNTGKYCTFTWECSICPTLTCWC